jgi:hypothetical protein
MECTLRLPAAKAQLPKTPGAKLKDALQKLKHLTTFIVSD